MSTHECPAPGCAKQVERDKLACGFHWFKIPKALRDEVWRTYQRYGLLSDPHTKAIRAAIASLEAAA